MASGKKINIAFLSVSTESCIHTLIGKITCGNDNLRCSFVKLTQQDLQSFEPRDTYDAVVLLHSISQGRNSITDVAGAKYSKLLPQLKKKYGPDRVAVVVHSMTSCNPNSKMVLMTVFKKSQPTTFQCSKCVIQCNNPAEIPDQDLTRLIEFLGNAPDHPLPVDEIQLPSSLTQASSTDKTDTTTTDDSSSATSSQVSSKVDPLENPSTGSTGRNVTEEKVIDTSFPIALIGLSSSCKLERLKDDLQQQLSGKAIIPMQGTSQLKDNWHLFETILVDCGTCSKEEVESAFHFCQKKMLAPQNLALLMPVPGETTSAHELASDIGRLVQLYKVPIFNYVMESDDPSICDGDTKMRMVSWLLDCYERHNIAVTQKAPGYWKKFKESVPIPLKNKYLLPAWNKLTGGDGGAGMDARGLPLEKNKNKQTNSGSVSGKGAAAPTELEIV